MIIVEKPFYSNCLFQAIKHKILGGKNVKIKCLWYKTKRMLHLHFYWQDSQYDYDFAPCRKWIGQILFKGNIHRHPKDSLKKLTQKMLKIKNKAR